MFTTENGQPIHDQRWAEMWAHWRTAAGWHALRHALLRTTLETYVHWWPKRDRPRGAMGEVFQEAATADDNDDEIQAKLSQNCRS